MQVIETEIPDVKIIIPDVHGDARGWFVEQYNAARYEAACTMVALGFDLENRHVKRLCSHRCQCG